MKFTLFQFVPPAFCAVLSLMALFGPSHIVFVAFLPMCFFFVALAMNQMQREILELRSKLEQLAARSG